MSLAALSWAFSLTLPPNEKIVLLALADCENDETLRCDPSQQHLAVKASMSERTVRRMLKDLEERGLVRRVKRADPNMGGRQPDAYRLALRGFPEADAAGPDRLPANPAGSAPRSELVPLPADLAGNGLDSPAGGLPDRLAGNATGRSVGGYRPTVAGIEQTQEPEVNTGPVPEVSNDRPVDNCHGDPVHGELTHERVKPFPGRLACDRYAAARRNTSFSCSSSRIRLRSSRFSTDSDRVTPGFAPSSTAARLSHFCNVIG